MQSLVKHEVTALGGASIQENVETTTRPEQTKPNQNKTRTRIRIRTRRRTRAIHLEQSRYPVANLHLQLYCCFLNTNRTSHTNRHANKIEGAMRPRIVVNEQIVVSEQKERKKMWKKVLQNRMIDRKRSRRLGNVNVKKGR